MTLLIDERADGSLAVYIDGDLQFDSRDEGIYHEALGLPALALAQRRRRAGSPLRALICGGGDGLVARELLKSPQVERIDLVDYDPTILCLARDEWGHVNDRALDNVRTFVHVRDAWDFVAEAASAGTRYDLIISDFTVPRDLAGARLHTVEWYEKLAAILAPDGAMGVNATSPSSIPAAYWSIYNTLRTAGLHPRPYRVVQPSFAAHGYGDDWGFFLAGRRPVQAADLADLPLAGPRRFLRDSEQLRRCFWFPATLAETRATARPTKIGSEWLLQALFNPVWENGAVADWDGLGWERDPAPLPAPDAGGALLPFAIQEPLAQPPGAIDEKTLLARVLDLMPALGPNHTQGMIHEFLRHPGRFLNAINLRAVVDALLRRAAELPRRLVAELRLLRSHLRRTWSSSQQLLQLGLRIVSVILIVIMLSNLFFPDSVYAKGGGTTSGGGVANANPSTGSFARSTTAYDVVPAPPSYVSGRGFRTGTYGSGRYSVDEVGTYYNTRSYRYYGSYYRGSGWRSYNRNSVPGDPNQGDALYKLTPETDLLGNGEIVIALTDQYYLLLADEVTSLVDGTSGLPIIFLKRDPSLAWRTKQELSRQRTGMGNSVKAKQDWLNWMNWIGFAHWRDDDEAELVNMSAASALLDKAIAGLGEVPAAAPALPVAPLPEAFQLFTGVWLDKNGTQLIVERADGVTAFITREGWWRDSARTQPIEEPYPDDLRKAIVAVLKKETGDQANVLKRIQDDLASAKSDLSLLQSDKNEYTSIQSSYGPSDEVEYGTSNMTVANALKLTNDDIARTQQLIDVLQKEAAEAPAQFKAEQNLLKLLDR
ncbi:MAG TPA: hypothetical protein VGE07_15980 [Herpetosiphonaceae bacterium]